MTNTFTENQMVVWTSQSAGSTKVKTGQIVCIVPPNTSVNVRLQFAMVRGRIKNPGSIRDHESYVVRAGGRLYWPRVSHLRPAQV